ncbi:MAG TPA: glycosyltransferase [Sedimenticola thiotaurini]|uniref:Glycosyltransferase n=1 Tax=Sedimenticola thiotaurini TaxID=1543721 RepID=A0A831W440_9GAMM|nr:glycosyltransferase [Sedimenticola thiotaurini]
MGGGQARQRDRIRVKFLSRTAGEVFVRQFPQGVPLWGGCEFLFDPDAADYDWLVVYDDLPPLADERFSRRVERLACPRHNTLLVTTEPETIKIYGRAYTAQFGHVLTSQRQWALPHPGRIHSQPALHWFYGWGSRRLLGYDEIAAGRPEKEAEIATVCSEKQQRHTLHHRRYRFVQELKARLPELEIYGHGVRDMDDKAESLDRYRYHVAIENYRGPHHWTEKLADCFLGLSLPFYYGCDNVDDYFPRESLIRIDIADPDGAARVIRRAMADDEYGRRLPALLEARRLVLEEYNLFAVLSREIEARHRPGAGGGEIRSRRLANKGSALQSAAYGLEKLVRRWRQR